MEEEGIVFQGPCYKQGGVVKNWKRRWMILRTDGRLYYYAINNSKVYPRDGFKGVIEDFVDVCQGETTELLTSWPRDAPQSCRFSLPTNQRTYHIYCDTAAECQKWAEHLNNTCRQKAKADRH